MTILFIPKRPTKSTSEAQDLENTEEEEYRIQASVQGVSRDKIYPRRGGIQVKKKRIIHEGHEKNTKGRKIGQEEDKVHTALLKLIF